MKLKLLTLLSLIVLSMLANAQETSMKAFDTKLVNWYNLDPQDNDVLGTSVDKTYKELLKDKKVKKVVTVAIIDGGVDINNPDLKDKIWVNKAEIPGNKIDDDKNGFVDDINGWNFIGNAKGENIKTETMECTRIYKNGPKDKDYEQAKALYEKELDKRTKNRENYKRFEDKYNGAKQLIKDKTGKDVSKLEDVAGMVNRDKAVQDAINFLQGRYEAGFTEKRFAEMKRRNDEYLEKILNVDYNPRTIIGDDPTDIKDNHYGNADVIGPRASHGTCLAGIIAGIRGNDYGVDGIATDVRIMVLRVVPNGDERDKDVALAIRYAVDNGADIINMSFGKALSPQKAFVDDAIRYADSKNVLLIHAAGNNGEDLEKVPHYPNDVYNDNTVATNFMNIGASCRVKDDSLVAVFSNYGKVSVDLFAPGVDIISLDTSNMLRSANGTSQAAPVVTGIAALVLSYYPDLKPQQLIALLMTSSTDLKKQKVLVPDLVNEKREKEKFKELSKSGGIVNAYSAMKMAEGYK